MKLHEIRLPVWNLPLCVLVAIAASLWGSLSLPVGISLPASSLHFLVSGTGRLVLPVHQAGAPSLTSPHTPVL